MGIVRMGIPEDIALFIKNTFSVNHFVETGTFQGGTSYWASQHFNRVETVEFSEAIFIETKKKLAHVKNINFIFGDSRAALVDIVRNATGPILFWLDAHWCSGASYGVDDQCPLLDELRIINNSTHEHYILIDDARLFEAPPPSPNEIQFYPTLKDLVEVSPKRYLAIFEDVIFILPGKAQGEFSQFLQKKTTLAWLEHGKKIKKKEALQRQTKFTKTKYLISDVLKIWNLK